MLVPSPRLFAPFRYFFALVAANDSAPLTVYSASIKKELCAFRRLGPGCQVMILAAACVLLAVSA